MPSPNLRTNRIRFLLVFLIVSVYAHSQASALAPILRATNNLQSGTRTIRIQNARDLIARSQDTLFDLALDGADLTGHFAEQRHEGRWTRRECRRRALPVQVQMQTPVSEVAKAVVGSVCGQDESALRRLEGSHTLRRVQSPGVSSSSPITTLSCIYPSKRLATNHGILNLDLGLILQLVEFECRRCEPKVSIGGELEFPADHANLRQLRMVNVLDQWLTIEKWWMACSAQNQSSLPRLVLTVTW